MTPAVVPAVLSMLLMVAAVVLAVLSVTQRRRAERARDESVQAAAAAEDARIRTAEMLAEIQRIAGEHRSGRLAAVTVPRRVTLPDGTVQERWRDRYGGSHSRVVQRPTDAPGGEL